MNKEEKEAIEIVKEIRKSDLMSAEFDIEELYNAIQTTLNLIDKLQKDNYELDRESQHFFDRIQDLQKRVKVSQNFAKIVERDYIDKDIIRDKIKELEEELIQNYGTLGESLTTTEIKTLKELLGE